MHIIEVSQISKKFGRLLNKQTVLNNVSFDIEKGEFVGIMGPSGAGKSTLLKIVSTSLKPDSGQIKINDEIVTNKKEIDLAKLRKDNFGFIFQDFNLLDSLNVRENIVLPLIFNKKKNVDINKRLAEINAVLNLEKLMKREVDELSGGQKQLVASARALINNPILLFADEPTGSLDSKSATQFLNYLRKINNLRRTTILMATHDAFTASYCDRIIFIKDGSVFAELVKGEDAATFFEKIINMQKTIGGGEFFDA